MVSTIAEPVLIAVISPAVGLAGIAKGATGLGFPIVAVPIIAVFVPVEHAVVVVTLPNLMVNAAMVREHRRRAAVMPWLKVMIATGMIGAVLGTLMLRVAPERALSISRPGLTEVGVVLFVRDLSLAPRGRMLVPRVDSKVKQERVRGGTVPVPLARRHDDDVPGVDDG